MNMNDKISAAACRLVETLKEKRLSAACAESCTGGLIAAALTSVPGSSEVFFGGIVSYAVSVKENVLFVSEKTIEECGVVSERCAGEMALGAEKVCGADIAVSVTGVAGPSGGTEKTPVGTVCFGIAHRGHETLTFEKHFDPALGREGIREAAVLFAIDAMQRTVQTRT